MDGLIRVLQSLPHLACRSITFDRGIELNDWLYLQANIGTQTWFCDPIASAPLTTFVVVERISRRAQASPIAGWPQTMRYAEPFMAFYEDFKNA